MTGITMNSYEVMIITSSGHVGYHKIHSITGSSLRRIMLLTAHKNMQVRHGNNCTHYFWQSS